MDRGENIALTLYNWIANEILFRSGRSATRASKLIPGNIKTRFAQTLDAAFLHFIKKL
jgi:hypothetical protein